MFSSLFQYQVELLSNILYLCNIILIYITYFIFMEHNYSLYNFVYNCSLYNYSLYKPYNLSYMNNSKKMNVQIFKVILYPCSDATWKSYIYGVPRGVMSFAMRSSTNVLATADNCTAVLETKYVWRNSSIIYFNLETSNWRSQTTWMFMEMWRDTDAMVEPFRSTLLSHSRSQILSFDRKNQLSGYLN